MHLDRLSLALGLIGLGILTLVYGDFALQWQPVPAWVPARQLLAYASGAVLVGVGAGLLSTRSAASSSRVLLVYTVLWLVLLKLPGVAVGPLVEVNWLGAGEIAVIVAGSLVLFGLLRRHQAPADSDLATADRAIRIARFLFAIALIPIGLSHFVYLDATIGFVPKWLPYRVGWAVLGGAGHLAAGLGVLFGVYPFLAATLEAAMIGVFTLLVWLPAVLATPTDRLSWTGMVMSWLIGAGAWVVAGRLENTDLRTLQRPP